MTCADAADPRGQAKLLVGETFSTAICVVGRMVAQGRFSSVYDVTLKSDHERTEEPSEQSESSDYTSDSKKKFVIKKNRHSCLKKKDKSLHQDLRLEADVLLKLPAHENIIELVGTSQNLTTERQHAARVSTSSAFLLFERLDETLEHKLGRWAIRHQKSEKPKPRFYKLFRRTELRQHQRKLFQNQLNRMNTCILGIARGMQHLHTHGVSHRDLKPANIGFDSEGTIKIFDFGLANRLDDKPTDVGNLSASVGTPRYMANEVMAGSVGSKTGGSSFPADVYSFGLILWQVLTLEKPFADCTTIDELKNVVVVNQGRPSLGKVAIPAVGELIERCWAPKPTDRPTFAGINGSLESILANGETHPTSLQSRHSC